MSSLASLIKERDSILGIITESLRDREMYLIKLDLASKELGMYNNHLYYIEKRINEQTKIEQERKRQREEVKVSIPDAVSEVRKKVFVHQKMPIGWVHCVDCGLSIEYGSKTPHGCGFSSD